MQSLPHWVSLESLWITASKKYKLKYRLTLLFQKYCCLDGAKGLNFKQKIKICSVFVEITYKEIVVLR